MLKRFLYASLLTVIMVVVGLLRFPDWLVNNAQYVILAGTSLYFGILTFDHWPEFLHFKQDYYWADLEVASRIFRDEIKNHGLFELAGMVDVLADEIASERPLAAAAKPWLLNGANRGQIKVTGVLKNGLARSEIPVPVKVADLGQEFGQLAEGEVVGADGNVYKDLMYKKAGVRAYVLQLSTDK